MTFIKPAEKHKNTHTATSKNVSHKIEYLFWLSQNVEDDNIFQRLIDFLSHYERIKSEFYAKEHNPYQKDMMELEDHDISYNPEYYQQELR